MKLSSFFALATTTIAETTTSVTSRSPKVAQLQALGNVPEMVLNFLDSPNADEDIKDQLISQLKKPRSGYHAVVIGFWGYGCWCNFDDKSKHGYGDPVDEVDTLCKAATQCLECAAWDGHQEGDSCSPLDVEYTSKKVINKPDGTMTDTEWSCSTAFNQDSGNCSTRSCMCHEEFYAAMWNYMLTHGIGVNQDYKHSSGKFDEAATCQRRPGTHDRSCCGDYPKRRPFNVSDNQCCENKTVYNSAVSQCCQDGSTKAFGDDCE